MVLSNFQLVSTKVRDRVYACLVERTILYKLSVSDIENFAWVYFHGPNSDHLQKTMCTVRYV